MYVYYIYIHLNIQYYFWVTWSVEPCFFHGLTGSFMSNNPLQIQTFARRAFCMVSAFNEPLRSEQIWWDFENVHSTETLIARMVRKLHATWAMVGNEPACCYISFPKSKSMWWLKVTQCSSGSAVRRGSCTFSKISQILPSLYVRGTDLGSNWTRVCNNLADAAHWVCAALAMA